VDFLNDLASEAPLTGTSTRGQRHERSFR
jgi:hypothetical protein